MRLVTALLIGVALAASPALARAQKSAAPAPGFEYLGTMQVQTGTRTVVENGPQGTRTIVQIVSGRFEGPRLKAAVQIPAGDWITNRADGSYRLDVRLTLKTDDGALILVTYPGVIDLGEDGYDRFLRGELPASARIRTSPRFATSHPRYLWLNRLHCIGIGEYVAANNRATYDVYAVR